MAPPPHPYNTNGKYFFNSQFDDDSLLVLKNGKAKVYKFRKYYKKSKVLTNNKNFCDGFRLVVTRLRDQLQMMNDARAKNKKAKVTIPSFSMAQFKVTDYDLIKCHDSRNGMPADGLFPVGFELIEKVKLINNETYKVSLNIDNPITLSGDNMDSGPQGTHFGYAIEPVDSRAPVNVSGRKLSRQEVMENHATNQAAGVPGTQDIIGHVLINTFAGFPSRNKEMAKKMTELGQNSGMVAYKFSELQRILSEPKYVFNYDLISVRSLSKVMESEIELSEISYPDYDIYFESVTIKS